VLTALGSDNVSGWWSEGVARQDTIKAGI